MPPRLKRKTGYILAFYLLLASMISSPDQAASQPGEKESSAPQGVYRHSAALIVHAEEYAENWPSVAKKPADHPEKLADLLEAQGFDIVEIQNPDSHELRQSLVDFLNEYASVHSSRILLYFSGLCHNLVPVFGGDPMEYLVPVDAPDPDENLIAFREAALSLFHLDHYIRSALSRHIMVILNGCADGSALTLKTAEKSETLAETAMEPVREFILAGKKKKSGPLESMEDRLLLALEGEADQNKDGWISGGETASYLKRNQDKKETLVFGKLEMEGAMNGEFLFPLQPQESETLIASVPPIRIPVFGELKPDGKFSREQNQDKKARAEDNESGETPLLAASVPEKAIQPAPFVKLTPEEMDENVYWPTEEESPPEKTLRIKEETFLEEKNPEDSLEETR